MKPEDEATQPAGIFIYRYMLPELVPILPFIVLYLMYLGDGTYSSGTFYLAVVYYHGLLNVDISFSNAVILPTPKLVMLLHGESSVF